jgi:hypothetical protein
VAEELLPELLTVADAPLPDNSLALQAVSESASTADKIKVIFFFI